VPLSHVLRDVSDQLALAELQHEPVMAGGVPAHERLDEDTLTSEAIPATPEGIDGDAFRADMVAA
jgi:hypothetical protein